MDGQPQQQFKPGKLIGYGGCGRNYLTDNDGGLPSVIKVFDANSISAPLLARMTERLEMGGWPKGVMPLVASNLLGKRPFWVTPLVARLERGLDPMPRTLQAWLSDHPGTYSWKLVRSLATALGHMHERRVAHGNLKPGNVFFAEDGEVLLSDWTMGNMPGIAKFVFTDAVLYQSPEQLRNPTGYLEDKGYRWDVFAFGVLAYRILTGFFPRCHETFSFVAPEPLETRRDGIEADLGKVANNLESQPMVTWPDDSQNPLEAGFRSWIERCLPLDPTKRPFTMIEVVAGFAELERNATLDAARETLMNQRRAADRRSWRYMFCTGGAVAAAVILGGLWHLTRDQLTAERTKQVDTAQDLGAAVDAAEAAKQEAETRMNEAQQALAYERELSLARLEASRLIGDHLFAWAMEKGNRQLPPLDGRELRLKRLERYFEDFLTRTASIETLTDERARVRLQLSEVSLAAGDAPLASKRLGQALKAWANLPMDAGMKFRLATNTLLLALLQQSTGVAEAGSSFIAARTALGEVAENEVDTNRLHQLKAVLDYHEARLLAARGEDTKALAQLMRATQTLNWIADQRPDAAILRSELAACYLSSATILEVMGNLGDAREVRALASVEFVKLLEKNPKDFQLRLDLAGCYGAMAESAVLSGDIGGAESISKEAMKLLDQLVVEQPDNAEAVSRKSAQLGLRAGIQRDRGFSTEAMADYNTGIRMLEALRASASGNAMVPYRLALLYWQKGRMLGMADQRSEEINLIRKADDLLTQLETDASTSGPRPEQLQSTGAYLHGDLGHALQLANQKEAAVRAFSDAAALWEGLLKSRTQSEEFSEGLEWCRHRLADLR
jgi:eukaryotic-like serine/threonine-protein kinase